MKMVRRILVVAALAAPSVPARGDEPPAAGGRVAIVASPAIIPAGARCRVELVPEARGAATVETTHEGKVVAADDEGLTLAVAETRRREIHNAGAARIPLIGRLFTNVGIGRAKPGEERELRVPAGAIRSVELIRD